MGFQIFQRNRIVVQDRTVPCRSGQFYDQEKHNFRIVIFLIRFIQYIPVYRAKVNILGSGRKGKRFFEYTPTQIFIDKGQKRFVIFQFIQNMIHDINDFITYISKSAGLQTVVSMCKQLTGFVYNQTVFDIIFIFEIQIKSAFGNTRFFYNVRNGCFINSFGDKEFKGCIQKRIYFQAFIFIKFANEALLHLHKKYLVHVF